MAISYNWSDKTIGLVEYADILDMKDYYSVNVTIFVYKMMDRLRQALTITGGQNINKVLTEAVKTEEYVDGAFEYDGAESDPLGILEREQTETDNFDDLMIIPENIIYYSLNPVIVAALMNDIDWLKRYSEKRNILDDAQNGKIYVFDNGFDYHHIMYAMWARILWIDGKDEFGVELWKIIEDQYNAADRDTRKEMLEFVTSTIAHIPSLEQKENYGLRFKIKQPQMYEDWVEFGDKTAGLPYTLVFAKEAYEYEQAGEKATAKIMKKSAELLVGKDSDTEAFLNYKLWEYLEPFSEDRLCVDISQIWFVSLEPDDDYVKKLRKDNSRKYRIELDKKKLRFFEDQLAIMGQLLRPEDFFTVLNMMWNDIRTKIREIPENNIGDNTVSREYITKKAGRYIEIIKKMIKGLNGKLKDIGGLYVKKFIDLDLNQYMFYANEFGTDGKLRLGLNALRKIGIPDDTMRETYIDVFDPRAGIDEAKERNRNIIEVWKRSTVNIARPKELHIYQKQLVEKCLDETLIEAAKCGIFPELIRGMLVEYAVQENLWDKIPVLIWLERGEVKCR